MSKARDIQRSRFDPGTDGSGVGRPRRAGRGVEGKSRSTAHPLRELEALHRDVQDGPFRQSLPENRQKLFTLLQGMEKDGGWPYIPRLQLRTFIDLLGQDSIDAAA